MSEVARARGVIAGIVALVIGACAFWSWLWPNAAHDTESGTVRVVKGVDISARPISDGHLRTDDIGTPTRMTALPPGSVSSSIAQRFPLLKDVVFECRAQECALSGTLTPAVSDDERDMRQAMLLGGLERLLAEHGYIQNSTTQMDELGDDEFQLRIIANPRSPTG